MTVKGLAELRARFKALPRAIQEEARRTLELNANDIVATMKRLVPKKTGALANSIGWTWGQAPKGSMAIGTVAHSADDAMAITIYAGTRDKNLGDQDAYYAAFQEFGTKNADGSTKMAANPFFFPAVRSNRAKGRARMGRNIRKAAAKAFNG